jgi:putative transposase
LESSWWKANLRVIEIDKIKSVPCVPVSHPFVERLIGTLGREYLDRMFFWNTLDLERKLQAFSTYYNSSRIHQSLSGNTPEEQSGKPRPACAALDSYGRQQHCRGLFQTPIAV